jgi:hypothetical protein
MTIATPKDTLMVVRYVYHKWRRMEKGTELSIPSKLARSTQKVFGTDETEQAEKVAEVLFPEQEDPEILLAHIEGSEPDKLPLHLRYVKFLDTFRSDLFGKLPKNIYGMHRPEKQQVLDKIYLEQPPQVSVGWIAVVDDTAYAQLIEKMYSNRGVLMKMYDAIEQYNLPEGWTRQDIDNHLNGMPLHGDRTTRQIYVHMSPVNWDPQ